jgi:hypothetical protein
MLTLTSPNMNRTALRAAIAWWGVALLLSGCATDTNVRFRFTDESTGKPLSGVTCQWNAIGGRRFRRAIPVETKIMTAGANDDSLAAPHVREGGTQQFIFTRSGYHWTVGDFSGGAFRTDGQIIWATNGVVVVPMQLEKTQP